VEVFVPQMPKEHTPEKWLEEIKNWEEKINEHTILIGHSLGCPTILHLLSQISKPVFGTIFVAGFGKAFNDETKEDEECNRFVQNISWKKAREHAGMVKIFSSVNDPEIPVDVSIDFGTMLKSPIRFIENAGHFCADDGFEKFPELLEYLFSQVYLTYEEFKKLDARVGYIKKVEPIEGADKLLRFEIDFGEGEDRQIVSGIREYFSEYEHLVGKKALYVLNLAPREIKGVTSYGMLMAVDGVDGKPVFLIPEQEVNPGSKER
jgi:methionine--tRNA ligase beta chain